MGKYSEMTDDQRFCINLLAEWAKGFHHLPKVHEFGQGVCINFYGDLATYGFDSITTLVLLAHRDAVRIEFGSSGPGMVKIMAHRRKVDKTQNLNQWEKHPTLADLKARIERMEHANI